MSRHRVYVASSWKNALQTSVVAALRDDGHEVYDFKNPGPGDNGFHWSEIDPAWREWTPEAFSNGLDHDLARKGFTSDMDALHACSACVLVLPCGKSAHLELGYAVGARKLTVVYMPAHDEPELMYRMVDYLAMSLKDVRRALSRERSAPRWQRDLPHGGTMDYANRCRPYSHRECTVCRGCWRHGSCECGPEYIK
jgi:hypothetical protein